jgi:4-carboxymuconolactone decarboxylase
MPDTPTFGRYTEIPYDKMTPEQQEGYRSLLEARGRLPGPNKIYVHNPKLVKVMGPLGAYFRTGYSLSEREREIAVVIINSKWHSAYPTNAHERAGKAAGLPADKVEALLSGLPTSFDDKREQVIYEMATCLANSRWVSKGLFDRAVEALGHEGITDLPDGILHQRVDDTGLLRRPIRCRGLGALITSWLRFLPQSREKLGPAAANRQQRF